MEFYNNNSNEPLKFKLNIEGIDTNNIETRLIIKNENKNYLIFGKVQEELCIFDVPELEMYEKGDNGTIKFEIISEDLYFPVWEDRFDIKTKASITFEQLVDTTKTEEKSKPKISASAILETTPIRKEEKTIVKETIQEEPKIEEKIVKKVDEIKNFDSFFE